MEWLVKLHTDLLGGSAGRLVNGWRCQSDAVVRFRWDDLVARPEVLAPQFAGELARQLSADQLEFA